MQFDMRIILASGWILLFVQVRIVGGVAGRQEVRFHVSFIDLVERQLAGIRRKPHCVLLVQFLTVNPARRSETMLFRAGGSDLNRLTSHFTLFVQLLQNDIQISVRGFPLGIGRPDPKTLTSSTDVRTRLISSARIVRFRFRFLVGITDFPGGQVHLHPRLLAILTKRKKQCPFIPIQIARSEHPDRLHLC